MTINRRLFLIGSSASVVAVACGGGDEPPATTPATQPVETSPISGPPATEPLPLETTPATSASVETTAALAQQTMPLTGIVVTDEVAQQRIALVVKIDNHPKSRPQSGLNSADIVYEENVEQLTRFAAVFHSLDANPVGPIRSGRTQDVMLLTSLNRALFAWSGGNGRVTAAVNASELRSISGLQPDKGYFRNPERKNPHDLYNTTEALFALAPADAEPPPAQFAYRGSGNALVGDDVAGIKVSMDGVRVRWMWDSDSAMFQRWTDEDEHLDDLDGTQLNAANIVVLFVSYAPSPADGNSPEAQTLGTGEVWVVTSGKLAKGAWSRQDPQAPFTLTHGDGSEMLLSPGRTYVELCRNNKAAAIPAGVEADEIAYP